MKNYGDDFGSGKQTLSMLAKRESLKKTNTTYEVRQQVWWGVKKTENEQQSVRMKAVRM